MKRIELNVESCRMCLYLASYFGEYVCTHYKLPEKHEIIDNLDEIKENCPLPETED